MPGELADDDICHTAALLVCAMLPRLLKHSFCYCHHGHYYQSELQTLSLGRTFPDVASASEMHGTHLLGCEAGMSLGVPACESMGCA